jgi:hypothetical protein
VHLLNTRPTHPTARFGSCQFWLYVFGRFSVRGVKKHHTNIFAKNRCQKLFIKESTQISMSVFLDFFCFIAFSGVSQQWEFKTHKKRFAKKTCGKCFTKKSKNNRKPISSIFLIAFLGVSWGGDLKNTI